MNRKDLRTIAEMRFRDAQVLFAGKRYSASYYVGGYAVECALKACIAKRTRRSDFPNKKRANEAHTHDLEALVKTAELESQRLGQVQANPVFAINWAVVKDWTPESRDKKYSRKEANDLVEAIGKPRDGVLAWVRKYW